LTLGSMTALLQCHGAPTSHRPAVLALYDQAVRDRRMSPRPFFSMRASNPRTKKVQARVRSRCRQTHGSPAILAEIPSLHLLDCRALEDCRHRSSPKAQRCTRSSSGRSPGHPKPPAPHDNPRSSPRECKRL